MEETFLLVFSVVVLFALGPFFMLPSILAYKDKNKNRKAIILANIGAISLVLYSFLASIYVVGILPALIIFLVLFASAIKGEARS